MMGNAYVSDTISGGRKFWISRPQHEIYFVIICVTTIIIRQLYHENIIARTVPIRFGASEGIFGYCTAPFSPVSSASSG